MPLYANKWQFIPAQRRQHGKIAPSAGGVVRRQPVCYNRSREISGNGMSSEELNVGFHVLAVFSVVLAAHFTPGLTTRLAHYPDSLWLLLRSIGTR